ncbi:TonB-dependent receptor [Erythrobacter sp.]|uniref:TonB-dependent receptor n=1 Tax=Erythrobacter sp. TaxID=1042 RepID=UPI0025E6CFA6|nr:TonB-dependent receptor [Erythrobacter sp.]
MGDKQIMKKIIRSALLTATMLTPGALMAQTDAEDTVEQPISVASQSNEIIVTARKREESLQSVPTSVSVTTQETIQRLGLDSLEEIANTTPGLFFDESFGRNGNRPVIRGQANILGESGVAFFIDGIYYTGSLADYDVDSIERIEVVKGPQSALYGRNTYSGAINIISRMPGDRWEGRIVADIAEHDRYELTAAIRGPVSDGLSIGLNGRFYEFSGEFTNQFDGTKIGKQSSRSVSGILAWDNGGPFTASLRGYYNRTDDGQPAIFHQDANQNNCLTDNGALYGGRGRYFCGIIQPADVNTDYSVQFVDQGRVGIEADTYNVALRMEYEFAENLRLVSLTGFNDRTETQLTDGDYSPTSFQTAVFARFPAGAPIGFGPAGPIFPFGFVGSTIDFSFANLRETQDWSQELKLLYESESFDIIVGGYYFDQSDDGASIRTVPANAGALAGASLGARLAEERARCTANPICGTTFPLFGPSTPNDRSENLLDIRNIAVYGAVNWHITPEFNLGIEGRYAEERIEQTVFSFNDTQMRPAPVNPTATFKAFTPRVTLDWQFTPDNMLYAIYAEGQKPGGFNGPLAITANAVDPNLGIETFDEEENKSFELGLKNAFFDGAVIFNLAGFYTDISGYQLTQNVSVPPNQISVVTNAGEAEIWGLEAELRGQLSPGLTLTANYALADTSFTSGVDENQGVLNDVADDGLVNCSTGDQFPDIASCQSAFGSIVGQSIPRAPRHRIFADLDYRSNTEIGGGTWDFFAGANITYTSSSYAQVHNLAETGSATEVDARMGIENDNYRIQLYVDNLFDEDAIQQIIRYADANNDLRRSFIGGLRPGRRFGLIVAATF